jgi:hypothetical protein
MIYAGIKILVVNGFNGYFTYLLCDYPSYDCCNVVFILNSHAISISVEIMYRFIFYGFLGDKLQLNSC